MLDCPPGGSILIDDIVNEINNKLDLSGGDLSGSIVFANTFGVNSYDTSNLSRNLLRIDMSNTVILNDSQLDLFAKGSWDFHKNPKFADEPLDNNHLSNKLYVDNQISGHVHVEADITDLDKYTQAEVDSKLAGKSDTGHTHVEADITDLDKFSTNEFIDISGGVGDAGKPVILNTQGQIDPSMLDVSTFYYVGPHDPSAGVEYPDTTGETHGAFWVVQGLLADYTFSSGDLQGMTVKNGDFMVWAVGGWSIMVGEMNPLLYYKLDGTQSITADFRAGGYNLINLNDVQDFESQPDDYASTIGQLKRLNADDVGAAWENHGHLIGEVEGLWDQLNSKANLNYVDAQNAAQDTIIAGKQNDLGLGSSGQLLATNTAADGTEWIDIPVTSSIVVDHFTGDGTQDTFPTSETFDSANIMVFINGVALVSGTDFDASSGTQIVFVEVPENGDEIIAYMNSGGSVPYVEGLQRKIDYLENKVNDLINILENNGVL